MADGTETPAPVAPSPSRRRRGVARAGAWLGAGLLLLAAVVATVTALLHSPAGTAWLLARVPGLAVQGSTGSLLGGAFAVERLQWQGRAGRLAVDGLQATGLRWQWRPAAGLWLGLQLDALAAQRVVWQSAPSGADTPAAAPASLRLPLALHTPLHIKRLEIDGAPALQSVQATLALGADGGGLHRIDALQLRWDGGQARATLQVGADAPMALALQAELGSLPGATQAWQATLQADGPLHAPALRGQLRGALGERGGSAEADLSARLAPFASFPLSALSLRTQDLDLSRLAVGLPETALSGDAELVEPAAGQPLRARVRLHNARPGRWNERRLPLRDAQVDLQAALDAPEHIQLSALTLTLGEGGPNDGAAGRVVGSGDWRGHGLTLELQVAGLVPQRLDGRAPAWRVDGALGLELSGLPSPDPAAAAAPEPWRAVAALALSGQHTDFPQPVQVQAQVQAAAGTLQLERLLARAGPAEVRAAGRLRQTAGGWATTLDATLKDLDPAPWWPGLGEAWQRGPHRLNAELTLDLRMPGDADWRRIEGQAALVLADSLLAGVPLAGTAALRPDGRVAVDLVAGGNRLDVELAPDRRGSADQWTLALDAPDLGSLAPLAALHPVAANLPRAGRLQAQGRLLGRWPTLQGEGSADAQGLVAGALQLDEATLRWQAGATIDAPLQASLQLSGLQWQAQKLARADLRLDGTLAEHRLRIDAALPLLPPDAVTRSLALRTQQGTRLAARVDGRLQRDTTAWLWRGSLQQLVAGSWDGRLPLAGAAPREWLDGGPLRAELVFDTTAGLQRLRADGGRLRVADTFTLAWDEVQFDARPGGSAGVLRLQAALEGFAVAPLLARWQPDMGWEGNLRVGGRLALSLGERTAIDLVIERESGDLGVRESAGLSVPLGLSDLRLALQAEDGVWTFTQALAGSTLGELGGVQRVHSSPQARWPAADDRLDGALAGRVANLGVWGAWVPAGWRLQGAVTSELRLGGRLGAPELRGDLSGDGLGVRNLLQGVHVRDGEVRVRLDGEQARIERFVLQGGDGSLTLSGGATLGAQPRADLVLQAERFQVLSRVDRRLAASGRATLALAPQALTLRGQFTVDEGLFDASHGDAPSLDDDVVVLQPGAEAAAADANGRAVPPPARRVDVAVDVDLGQQLRVRGRGLDTRLAGQLRISAPGGRLAVHGTVNAVAGTYAAYAQKLEIRRGELAFSGDAANPRLDVLALRPNLDIEVGVAITGNAQTPRVRLYSNPEQSETDKLSWLVLGRDPAGLGRADTALLQRAAVALLAGEGEAPTDTLMRNLGLDEFSVRQDDDSAGDTIVSLGKQLSRRWYVGYERGVNATVGTWQLIYRVAQRFTLRAQSGAENSLDAIWVWRVP